jgi:hypothetical protein
MVATLFIVLCFACGSQATTVPASATSRDGQAASSATPASEENAPTDWRVGGFFGAYIKNFNSAANHLFRNRGSPPPVDEFDLNLAAASLRKPVSNRSRWGLEVTTQAGQDSQTWAVRQPWSITLRPEVAWDRQGRWIGAPQSVGALTTILSFESSVRE